MIAPVLLLGAVAGGASLVAWRLLFPPPPPLGAALERLGRRPDLVRIAEVESGSGLASVLGRRLGPAVSRLGQSLGLRSDALASDLRVVGRPLEEHLGQKVLLGFIGLTLPPLTSAVMRLGGVSLGITIPMLLAIALGLVFFFVPDLLLRSEAEDRRREFRHSLGSFLDLVVISLAGGAGVDSALRDAAAIGRGWTFLQLRNALEITRLTGETPWAALARLGVELGVGELGELAASVSLAGTEGARVRESLAAKATSLRDHALARAETEAQETTERMAMPVVLLFVGFLLLIGYPAVDAVLTGV